MNLIRSALMSELGSNISLPTAVSCEHDNLSLNIGNGSLHRPDPHHHRPSMLQLTPVATASSPLVAMDVEKSEYYAKKNNK